MGIQKLSKTAVDALSPRPAAYCEYDAKLTGFCVRVMPTGFKSYCIEYRAPGLGRAGAKRRKALGSTDKLTFDQAYKIAKKHLDGLSHNIDPIEEERAKRAALKKQQEEREQEDNAPTVESLVRDYINDHVADMRKPNTVKAYKQLAQLLVYPRLGKIKAVDLDYEGVDQFRKELSTTPSQANHALALISAAYRWGSKKKHVPRDLNPARGVERYKEEGRERFLSTEEIERLGAALNAAEDRFGAEAVAAVKLMLLTGARSGEILGMTWDEIDFERGQIFKRDSKNGKKAIPLGQDALSILKALPRKKKTRYVFSGREPGTPRSDLRGIWSAVCEEAELEGVRRHDLRHTFASIAAARGYTLHMISKALGHKDVRTTKRYAHIADAQLQHAVDDTGGAIARALGGEKTAGNIVAFNRGGRR